MFIFFKVECLNKLWYIHSMEYRATVKIKFDALIRKECQDKVTGNFKYRTICIQHF